MSTESGVGTLPIVGRSRGRLTSAVAVLVEKSCRPVYRPCNLLLRQSSSHRDRNDDSRALAAGCQDLRARGRSGSDDARRVSGDGVRRRRDASRRSRVAARRQSRHRSSTAPCGLRWRRCSTTDHVGTGDSLGPYHIEARLGAGGMGEVFRATDTRLNRAVAIKILPTSGALDQRGCALASPEKR